MLNNNQLKTEQIVVRSVSPPFMRLSSSPDGSLSFLFTQVWSARYTTLKMWFSALSFIAQCYTLGGCIHFQCLKVPDWIRLVCYMVCFLDPLRYGSLVAPIFSSACFCLFLMFRECHFKVG